MDKARTLNNVTYQTNFEQIPNSSHGENVDERHDVPMGYDQDDVVFELRQKCHTTNVCPQSNILHDLSFAPHTTFSNVALLANAFA